MPSKLLLDAALAERLPTLPPGLLLGTTTPPHLLSYHATPPTPSNVSPIRWATEHANLLSAMCPGGISVLARYVPKPQAQAEPLPHLPFLIALTSSAKLVAKERQAPHQDLRSADIRTVPALANAIVHVTASVYVPPLAVPVHLSHEVEPNCEQHLADLLSHAALALSTPTSDQLFITQTSDEHSLAQTMNWSLPMATAKQTKPPSAPLDPLQVDILLPLGPVPAETTNIPDLPIATVAGTIHMEALVTCNASHGDLLRAVREDLSRSLHARVQLMTEEQDDDYEEDQDDVQAGHPSHKPALRAMPVRVVARPKVRSGRIPMSDYLMQGESIDDDVMSRFVEVLSWGDEDIEAYQLVQSEQLAPNSGVQSEKNDTAPLEDTDATKMKALDAAASAPMTIAQSAVIAAFIMAILAIIVKELL